MSNDLKAAAQKRTALPSLVLAVMAVAFLLVSVARAEDPPVISVGPVSSSGNTASGGVGSDGKTTACVNDDESQADPSTSTGALKLNQGSCQESGGTSGSGGSQAGSGSRTDRGSQTGSVRGASGSTTSSVTTTAWVAAANAVGLRIVRVRHVTKGVSVTKRFRAFVTLRECPRKARA